MSGDRMAGTACAIAAVTLFSSFTLVSRLGLASTLTLPDLAALRFGIGGCLLLPVLLRRGLGGVRRRDAAVLALLGGVGFAPLAYAGFSLSPAAHGAVLLHGTLPLFTHLLLRATGGQAPTPRRTAGVAVIAAGIALMARDSLAHADARQLLGMVCCCWRRCRGRPTAWCRAAWGCRRRKERRSSRCSRC